VDVFTIALTYRFTLQRIWLDQMELPLLEELSEEIKELHKSMKNIIEIVFAISPLMVLSTYGWGWRSTNSTYLLRVSDLYFKSWQLFKKDE